MTDLQKNLNHKALVAEVKWKRARDKRLVEKIDSVLLRTAWVETE